jgi:Plavaka transposase
LDSLHHLEPVKDGAVSMDVDDMDVGPSRFGNFSQQVPGPAQYSDREPGVLQGPRSSQHQAQNIVSNTRVQATQVHASRMQPTRSRPRIILDPLHLDYLPEGAGPLADPSPPTSRLPPEEEPENLQVPASRGITGVLLRVRETFNTNVNLFGLYREYRTLPANIPDENADVADLTEVAPKSRKGDDVPAAGLGLFGNASTLNFLHWFWNCGSLKSVGDRDRLVREVFHAPGGFNPDDVQVAHLHRLDNQHKLSQQDDRSADAESEPLPLKVPDGWIEATVEIPVPDGISRPGGEGDAPKYFVPNFYYRKLTEVIKEAFTCPPAKRFHYTGYKQFWKPPGDPSAPPQRVYDELYTSDSFLAAEEEIHRLPPEPNCKLPRAVAGMMCSSDALQLANFGTASLWPGYTHFANQTKWERTKPRARAAHHIAYFPKVIFVSL